MSGLARRRQVQQEETQSSTPAFPDLAEERIQDGFNVDAMDQGTPLLDEAEASMQDPESGDAMGVWSEDNSHSPLTSKGAAGEQVFSSAAEAEAYAAVVVPSAGAHAGAVVQVDGGYAVHLLESAAWWDDFDAGTVVGGSVTSREGVVCFVTTEGHKVAPDTTITEKEGLDTASSESLAELSAKAAKGEIELDDTEKENLFKQRIRARAVESLDTNRKVIEETVRSRYDEKSKAEKSAEQLHKMVEMYDTLNTTWLGHIEKAQDLSYQLQRKERQIREQEGGQLTGRSSERLYDLQMQREAAWAASSQTLVAERLLLSQYPELDGLLARGDVTSAFGQVNKPTEDSYTSKIEGMNDEAVREMMLGRVDSVLSSIDEGRQMILTDDVHPYTMGPVVQEVLKEMAGDPFQKTAEGLVADKASSDALWSLVVGVVDIGLLIGGTLLGGPLGAALVGSSMAVSAGSALVALESALDQQQLANTHLDRSKTVVDQRAAEEAMFWAIVEASFVGLDGIQTVASARRLAKARKCAKELREEAEKRAYGLDLGHGVADDAPVLIDDMAKKKDFVSGSSKVSGDFMAATNRQFDMLRDQAQGLAEQVKQHVPSFELFIKDGDRPLMQCFIDGYDQKAGLMVQLSNDRTAMMLEEFEHATHHMKQFLAEKAKNPTLSWCGFTSKAKGLHAGDEVKSLLRVTEELRAKTAILGKLSHSPKDMVDMVSSMGGYLNKYLKEITDVAALDELLELYAAKWDPLFERRGVQSLTERITTRKEVLKPLKEIKL